MFTIRRPEYDVNRERLKPNRPLDQELVRLTAMGLHAFQIPVLTAPRRRGHG